MLLWTKLNHLLMNKWFLPTQTARQRHNYVTFWCVTWSHLKKLKKKGKVICHAQDQESLHLDSPWTTHQELIHWRHTEFVIFVTCGWNVKKKPKCEKLLKKPTELKQHQGQPFSPSTLVDDSYLQRHLRECESGIFLPIITPLLAGNHVNPDNEYSISL